MSALMEGGRGKRENGGKGGMAHIGVREAGRKIEREEEKKRRMGQEVGKNERKSRKRDKGGGRMADR